MAHSNGKTVEQLVKETRKRRKLAAEHYDSAETTQDNYKHWGPANPDLSIYQANNPGARRRMRSRAQYECDSNTYCSGMIDNYTTDVLGSTPPSLCIMSEDSGLNREIEDAWARWAYSFEVNLPSKLVQLNNTKTVQGEGYTLYFTDSEAENATGISLNFGVISPRRVTDPFTFSSTINVDNGLLNDDGVYVSTKTGRPVRYRIMTNEDEARGLNATFEESTIDARFVTQWFMPKRADQFRGISEIQAALPLFAYLRRYTLAMISSAELIASLTAFLKTQNTPAEGPVELVDRATFEITRNMLNSVPDGWEPVVLDQKHPSSTYEMFVNLILREIGRVLNMPFGVMVGDSSKYNYSSARLDYNGYEDRLRYVRTQLDIRELNRIYSEWIKEYVLTDAGVRRKIDRKALLYRWRYSTRPSIDPQKDASTEDTRLRNGTTTLQEVYSQRGEDWEEAMEQRKREMEKVQELGLTGAFDYLGIGGSSANQDQLPIADEVPANA